ncbi:hypothetical protein LTR15_004717 [Elasticomyces elasticus]|nr:hypothetical protein LTR15_004717 [Elasticomyces elasticus]
MQPFFPSKEDLKPTSEKPSPIRSICLKVVKRKDDLRRHEINQHDGGRMHVCDICSKAVRPRQLPQHWKSHACMQASQQKDGNWLQRLKHAGSVPGNLPAILDIVLMSAWFFVKVRPWGCHNAGVWLLRPMGSKPSIEVLELKGVMSRGLGRALRNYDPLRDTTILDSLMIFAMVMTWLDGFEATLLHTKEIVHREYQTSLAGGVRTYEDAQIADILTFVLSHEVEAPEIQRCRRLAIEGLNMVRESARHEIAMAQTVEPDLSRYTRSDFQDQHHARLIQCASWASEIPG